MRFVYSLAGAFLAFGLVLALPSLVVSNPSGAPVPFNGGPNTNGGTNPTCVVCHGSFELNSGTGSVAIDAPDTFAPGETISVTVTVDNTTDPLPGGDGLQQGFLLSAQLDDGTQVGEFVIVDDETTQLPAAGYVTHTEDGIAQSAWTVEWTAPADAPESVTFYVAGNAGNGGNGPSGDYIYTDAVTVDRMAVSNESDAAPLVARIEAVYPNPFVSAATVDYTLDRALPVTVTLLDGLGRTVRVLDQGPRGAGTHVARVNSDGLAAGIYFVEVRTPESVETRAVSLTR